MADQVGECDVYSTVPLGNTFSVNALKKEECKDKDYVDDEVQISEAATLTDVQDNLILDKIKQDNISTGLDNIKTEVSLPEIQYDMINDNIKIEEGISTDNMKIEFTNRLLYCEDCQAYCEDYCAKCEMLVHILNRTLPMNADNKSREELPKHVLEIRDYSGEHHIFALKIIPARVKFGPFTGLNGKDHRWKIKGGKFVVNKDESKYLSWMQYISPAKSILERNLCVFQYEHDLYYESTRRIQQGDELLVYFGEEYEDSLNRNVEVDFIPTSEHGFKEAFACTFCCLGFSSKSYLAKHKTICHWNADGGFSIEGLMQCPSCKINLDQKEYTMHHMAYCCERNDRKRILPTSGNRTTLAMGRKAQSRQMHKCQQCMYRTKYKADLKHHTNQHYEVKMYKCEVCSRRFKTKDVLMVHVENAHICADEKNNAKDSTGVYVKVHVKAEHSCSQDDIEQLQCSLCDFRTKYKHNLKRHLAEKHLKKFNYQCDTCEFKTNTKSTLKSHVEARHLKEFKYKCGSCDYRTNWKSTLKGHIETRHLKQFKYNCEACDYKTNLLSQLKSHLGTRHLKEFKYKCDICDYKANQKYQLKSHIVTRHLNEFKYKCDRCDYKASQKSQLKSHMETRHLKEFKYKCDSCDYRANLKSHLKIHVEARHLKEFKYKCETCEYKANQKSHLKRHVEAKHLKEVKYKCDTCDYKAYQKIQLKSHIERIHLKEFKYACDRCDYKANLKSDLKKHTDAKHLKEFKYKCDWCDYKVNLNCDLKKHIERKHLKELKYKCETCDYKANTMSNLKRHAKAKHLQKCVYVVPD